MRILIILLLFAFNSTQVSAQVKVKSNDGPTASNIKWGDLTCVHKPKYSLAQRLKSYPFNKADTIKIISYRFHKKNSPIKNDDIITDSLIEIKILSSRDIEQLTDIIYNNFTKKQGNIDAISQCYWPRNAIIFIDKFGHLLGSIEICFTCGIYRPTANIEMGDHCEQKIEKLREYFRLKGIKFGTAKDSESIFYPGETDER